MYCMLKELIQVKPSEGQSLYEFYFQQKSRIDRLRLSFREQDIISIIVGSIGDKNISTAAEAGSFRYCDELASFLHSKYYSTPTPQSSQKISNASFQKQHTSRPSTSNHYEKKKICRILNHRLVNQLIPKLRALFVAKRATRNLIVNKNITF